MVEAVIKARFVLDFARGVSRRKHPRENAEQKLVAMLEVARQGAGKTAGVQQQGAEVALRKTYDYWLKANASLKSMGIYELPLPDALQAYQAGLGLDE